ncbi:hypothetical protein ACKUB1_17875 [Methanospirillum stamsii]|uniref:Nucleotide-binding protein n=1 Tax=Methanospirillum stamsii TaxID=1277351 RepID=A0A2V2NDJ4_9EURY|nr:hypothetical protein [Methanospirillum stamsii]PWR73363.1 hypothetical protein DLD82_10885 [Methanospirillum stamsii]
MTENIEALCARFVPLGIDQERILTKFNRFTEEFSIPADEAIRTLAIDFSKELGIVSDSGERNTDATNFIKIGELNTNTLEADIIGTLQTIEIPSSEKLSYSGVISDETGSIRFVVSSSLNNKNKDIPYQLIPGKTYEFLGVSVSEYNGMVSIFCSGYSLIRESKTAIPSPEFNPRPIYELMPGVSDLRARVIRSSPVNHEKIQCAGTLADETGICRFIAWKSPDNASLTLEQDKTYDIRFATISTREGQRQADISGSIIKPSDKAILKPADDKVKISGFITRMKSNTGRGTEPVYRCPECRKIVKIQREGYACEKHGIINPVKEFRTKCRLDNGSEAWSAILNQSAILQALGWTRDQIFEFRDSHPLGDGIIDYEIYDRLFGRKVTLIGSLFSDDRIIADGLELAHPESQVTVSGQEQIS